jgi:hypothetical protein
MTNEITHLEIDGKGWRTVLIAPDGEIMNVVELGKKPQNYAVEVAALAIEKWLPTTTLSCKEFILKDVSEMLTNEKLLKHHVFRLAWGNINPTAKWAWAPEGHTHWTLYWCGNGLQEPLISGELPEDYWSWDLDERANYLESIE